MPTRSLALSLLILTATLSAPARAADDVAYLEKTFGTVKVLHRGKKAYENAKEGDSLVYGDIIETRKGGIAHVAFANGAIILMRENAAMTVGGTQDRSRIYFPIGEFLIGLKRKLLMNQSFRVRTPSAVAAVRGTLFWGKVDEDKSSTFACFHSTITIEAGGASIELPPGQTVKIPYGQPPGKPEASTVPASYVMNFAVDGSIQGLDSLVEGLKKEEPQPKKEEAPKKADQKPPEKK